MDWTAFFGTLIQSEEPLVPFFAHDPLENAISAAVIVAESAVPAIIQAIQSAGKPTKSTAPASTTVTATSSSTPGPVLVPSPPPAPTTIITGPATASGPVLVPSPAPGA